MGLLYFFSPPKNSFKEDRVVTYVVIMDKKIIQPITKLKNGILVIEILAKGMSRCDMSGFDRKQTIPINIRNVRMVETIMLHFVCSVLVREFPHFIIAKDDKKVF